MTNEPSGVSVFSPKIANEALVRKFVSLNGQGYVAISIQQNQGTAVDPDAGTLSLAVWFLDPLTSPLPTNPYGTLVNTVGAGDITKTATGQYYYDLGPSITANRGLITCVWTYQVSGTAFQFTDHLQVLDPMPLYDSLSAADKATVEQVSWMFGDLYDSTEGGPHLIEEFQTHWNSERIAQMMSIAVMRMNFIGNFGNAPTTWSVGGVAGATTDIAGQQVTNTQTMPDGSSTTVTYYTSSSSSGGGATGVPSNMSGLVVIGTYLEIMRHLRDSYTEIPQRPGMDVTYTDRSNYQQRWASNLSAEVQDWQSNVKKAKMSALGMSRGSLLVAGGMYGGSMGVFVGGMYAAQVRSFRFYPAAPAISWSATAH